MYGMLRSGDYVLYSYFGEALLWNAVLLFNPEFAICVIWILDMYISRIDFVISW